VSLAIATNTMPSWWLGESEETILTALQLLDEAHEGK
jgi:hypothetical protein